MSDAARRWRGYRMARCETCRLVEALCLCAELPRLDTATRVLLVVHATEWRRTTNTGRLAHAVLTQSEVRLRGEPGGALSEAPLEGRACVLFPAPGARVLAPSDAGCALLVPDGAWNQSGKMLRREPLFANAEPVKLPDGAPSEYALREVRPGLVCTYEAIARALGVLEGGDVERAMLRPFRAFVGRTLWARGQLRAEDVEGGIPEAARAMFG